jgi:hypothetical protein
MPSPFGARAGRVSRGRGATAFLEFVSTPGASPAPLSEATIITTPATRGQRRTVIIKSSFLVS